MLIEETMNRFGKYAPSNTAFFFALFFSVFVLAEPVWDNLFRNGDTFFHVWVGKYLLQHLHGPPPGAISFAEIHGSFLHEWLGEAVMGGIESIFGIKGLVFFFAILICVTMTFVFSRIDRRKMPGTLAMACVFVLFFGTGIHFQARPHVFSLLLLVIYHAILDTHQHHGKNHLWALPPLMVLWANLHGGYVVGILVVAAYLGGNLLAWSRGDAGGAGKSRKLAIVMAVTVLATLVSPDPIKTITFPFQVVSAGGISADNIEFMSPDMHKIMFAPFFVLVLMTAWVVATSKERLEFPETLLLTGMLAMALYGSRFTTLYSLIAIPTIARRFPENALYVRIGRKDIAWALAVVAVMAIGAGALGKNYELSNRHAQPVGAIQFLKENHFPGNMFNHCNYASLILYETFPRYRVFIDNRADVFGSKRYELHNTLIDAKEGWRQIIEQWRFDWVFIPSDSELSKTLSHEKGWTMTYGDEVAKIFKKVEE